MPGFRLCMVVEDTRMYVHSLVHMHRLVILTYHDMYALQQAILNAHTSSNRATTVFPIVYFYA